MGKTLSVGSNRGGWFAGAWTGLVVGICFRKVGLYFWHLAGSVVPLAGESGLLTMSNLAAVVAFLVPLPELDFWLL